MTVYLNNGSFTFDIFLLSQKFALVKLNLSLHASKYFFEINWMNTVQFVLLLKFVENTLRGLIGKITILILVVSLSLFAFSPTTTILILGRMLVLVAVLFKEVVMLSFP
jgi:hypothetical protein